MTEPCEAIAGIDTHADTIHVAVITATGGHVAERWFGCRAINPPATT
jgi:hypothetical protein